MNDTELFDDIEFLQRKLASILAKEKELDKRLSAPEYVKNALTLNELATAQEIFSKVKNEKENLQIAGVNDLDDNPTEFLESTVSELIKWLDYFNHFEKYTHFSDDNFKAQHCLDMSLSRAKSFEGITNAIAKLFLFVSYKINLTCE